MKIKKIQSFYSDKVCVVKVTSEDGAFGFGQCAPKNADITQLILHKQVCPHVLGQDDGDFSIADKVILKEYKFTGSYIARAVSGIDTALWDLKGRREKRSVASIIGKKRERIMLYGSSKQREIPVAQEIARMQKLRNERGYGAFKLRGGMVNGNDMENWPGHTEDLIQQCHKELGPHVELYVDANGGFSVERSQQLLEILEKNNVKFLEEPCPYWEIDKTKEIKNAFAGKGVLIAAGEQEYMFSRIKRLIKEQAIDVFQPDICCIGGFSRAYAASRLAANEGIFTTPHCSTNTMLFPFSIHLMAVVDKPWRAMEHVIESEPWAEKVLKAQPEIKDGYVRVPEEPGWGFEPSSSWLSGARVAVSE
ncbi:MAG: mandelate racemase/muconate lactonizing enzyme family protein [Clostridiales bacterium]|nr:mandelate racemase/muconate lactonizing enzyme family protein [Clostridiales bacterium]